MDKYMCLKLILHNPFVPVLPIFLHISDIYKHIQHFYYYSNFLEAHQKTRPLLTPRYWLS